MFLGRRDEYLAELHFFHIDRLDLSLIDDSILRTGRQTFHLKIKEQQKMYRKFQS